MRKPSENVEPHSDSQPPAPRPEAELEGSGMRPAPAPDAPRSPDAPLDERDLELIARAGVQARAIGRARGLAWMNGFGLLACALGCVLGALFDAFMLLPALALGACALVELRGARMLQRFDLRAPRWLALNQLALLVVIAIYCGVNGVHALREPNELSTALSEIQSTSPDVAEVLRDSAPGLDTSQFDLGGALGAAFYAVVFVVCALYQGFCAQYYRSRAAVLRSYVDQTPSWVREVQRRLSG